VPGFQTDEDAINRLEQLLNQIEGSKLLILDDVWSGSEFLPEKFKFHMSNYKILMTSRDAFPRFRFTYKLQPLNDKDAMTLFRHSASLQDGISSIRDKDIKKVLCQPMNTFNVICHHTFRGMNIYETKKIHDVIACFNKYIIPWLPAKIMFAYLCMDLCFACFVSHIPFFTKT
jgi:hypothetical protein